MNNCSLSIFTFCSSALENRLDPSSTGAPKLSVKECMETSLGSERLAVKDDLDLPNFRATPAPIGVLQERNLEIVSAASLD